MIALDTNVLVRFLVEDDKTQSNQAKRLIQKNIEQKNDIFISDLVLVETVWVLKRAYKLKKAEIVSTLRLLLAAKSLHYESNDRLHRASSDYEKGRGDFADYLIRQKAFEKKCEYIATFDRQLLKENGFIKPK
jgi:predicted nucleic-acid-binding protein